MSYKLFSSWLELHKFGLKNHPESIESIGQDETKFTQQLENTFSTAKIFEINEDIQNLLLNTEGSKEIDKLPFDETFISTNINTAHLNESQFGDKITQIAGILICEANKVVVVNEKEMVMNKTIDLEIFKGLSGYRIYYLALTEKGGYSFNTVNIINKDDCLNEYNLTFKTNIPKTRTLITNFVSNFLNLINNQERNNIQIVEKIVSEAKNKQLARKGEKIIPNTRVIIPIGELRDYLRTIQSQSRTPLTHRFWVRGHWRHLRTKEDEEYRIWLRPYIKGKTGILIEKTYEVKET